MSSSPGVGVIRDMRLTWCIYIGVRKDCQQTIGRIFQISPGPIPRGLAGEQSRQHRLRDSGHLVVCLSLGPANLDWTMVITDGPHRITEAVHERLDGQGTIPKSHSNRNVLNGEGQHHKLPKGIVVRELRSTWCIYIGVRMSCQQEIGRISEVPRADSRGR
jgi:hypothetical protein